MNETEALYAFCDTDKQREYLKALEQTNGNRAAAARLMGINVRNFYDGLRRLKLRAAKAGAIPNQQAGQVAEGYKVKGSSVLYDPDGAPKLTWLKTDYDQQAAHEAILAAIESACEGITPTIPTKPQGKHDKDLCNTYILTDFHLGMYAWGEETGGDWDTGIAERVMVNAFADMISASPDAELGVFAQMGDFLHWDGLLAVTPTNKHVLDADTRFDALADLALKVCIQVTDMLLVKHKQVRVLMCEGNHDEAGSVWIRKALKYYYAKEKRVTVDDTPFPYYAFQHGKIMVAFHHGHKVRNKALPELFAAEPRYRQMWGDSEYTYIHTGHYHQSEQDVSEQGGAIVERHPTLAARDAYAARGGYISRRGTRCITYHKEHGEIHRTTVLPRVA